MWDVGGDQFDSLDETNLGRLEFEDLSLDEPELEAVMFDGANENEAEDDVIGLWLSVMIFILVKLFDI